MVSRKISVELKILSNECHKGTRITSGGEISVHCFSLEKKVGISKRQRRQKPYLVCWLNHDIWEKNWRMKKEHRWLQRSSEEFLKEHYRTGKEIVLIHFQVLQVSVAEWLLSKILWGRNWLRKTGNYRKRILCLRHPVRIYKMWF